MEKKKISNRLAWASSDWFANLALVGQAVLRQPLKGGCDHSGKRLKRSLSYWGVLHAEQEQLPVRKICIGGFSNVFSISRVACWLGENWGSRIWCLLCRVSAALRFWCGCRVEEGFPPQRSVCFLGSISYRGGGGGGDPGPLMAGGCYTCWERAALPCHSPSSGGLWLQHPGVGSGKTGAPRGWGVQESQHLTKYLHAENINKCAINWAWSPFI